MYRYLILSTIFCVTFSKLVIAGVTIHFEGTVSSNDNLSKIFYVVKDFAAKNKWTVEDASSDQGVLQRVINEENKDYKGKITGIVVRISDQCEPLYFQFGDDLLMQDFVKTQFAGPDVHIKIVELLEIIKPYFKNLNIIDEGEYWETKDREILEKHMNTVNSIINEIKENNPKAVGPIMDNNGRIIDVIQ